MPQTSTSLGMDDATPPTGPTSVSPSNQEPASAVTPPAYSPSAAAAAAAAARPIPEGAVLWPMDPPSYDTAAKLPSYEEAERTKEEESGLLNTPTTNTARNPLVRGPIKIQTLGELLWGAPRQAPANMSQAELQRQVMGTDMEFLCCFLIALVFNGLGLVCALCCLTASIAGRSGAISGFGLSIIKWGLVILHQRKYDSSWFVDTYDPPPFSPDVTPDLVTPDPLETQQAADTVTFTCWLIVALGVLFFFQGIIHYFKAKKCSQDINWLKQRYNRSS